MTSYELIGKNIKRYREIRRLTQEELAFRSSTSSAYISKIELGKSNPTIDTIERICRALSINIIQVLEAQDAPVPEEPEINISMLHASLASYQHAFNEASAQVQFAISVMLQWMLTDNAEAQGETLHSR